MAGQTAYRKCWVPLSGKVAALQTIKGEGVREGAAPLLPNRHQTETDGQFYAPAPLFARGNSAITHRVGEWVGRDTVWSLWKGENSLVSAGNRTKIRRFFVP